MDQEAFSVTFEHGKHTGTAVVYAPSAEAAKVQFEAHSHPSKVPVKVERIGDWSRGTVRLNKDEPEEKR